MKDPRANRRRYLELLLLPQHEAMLAASAISPDVATARGYKSAREPRDLKIFGFSERQRRAPALAIPVWSVATGKIAMYQTRPDTPRVNNGKPVKYETPHEARMALDCNPIARAWLADPARPLFITEGIRKADAAVSRGLCCVAVLGVWNWRGRNEKGGLTVLADWESIALNGRQVYIVYDSDVMLRPQVHEALVRVKALLQSRGANVALIYLPPGEGGAKVGLDDYFNAGHTIEQLLALSTSEVRALVQVASQAPSSADLGDPAPWPDPVDGAALVEGMVGFFSRYAVLPEGGALVLALWTIGTWLNDVFDAFGYLAVTSPQRECGKSLVLKLLACLCRRPLPTANISEAALFRVIEKEMPTLLIDEAQQLRVRDERSAALHDLLCAGYQRGSFVYRMAGANRDELRRFSVYCPKAIALIGKLTNVLMDRAIEIKMRRRKHGERIARFFLTRPPAETEPLRRQLARWAADHRQEVRETYHAASLPDWLEDREAELWAPLLSIVRAADPDRLPEVERIAKTLAGVKAETDDSLGVRLLTDLRGIFGDRDFLPTKEIIEALVAVEDGPWPEYRAGKPLTPRGLAELLRPFEIEPGKARHEERVGVRGYFREAFRDAFDRYTPSPATSNPPQAPQARFDKGLRLFPDPPQPPLVADGEINGNASDTRPVADVADESAQEDPLMGEAVRRWGPPVEVGPAPGKGREPGDGRRGRVLDMGRSLGWPTLPLGPGESVGTGERDWHVFVAKCTDAQLTKAIEFLRGLEEPVEPGEVLDDDISLQPVPENIVDYSAPWAPEDL